MGEFDNSGGLEVLSSCSLTCKVFIECKTITKNNYYENFKQITKGSINRKIN